MLGPLRTRNSIRLEFPESRREEVTRDYVAVEVARGILKMGPEQILCMLSFEKVGVYELSFRTGSGFVTAAERLAEKQKDKVLKGVKFELCGCKFTVIIQMFNPYVLEEDLVLFLKKYCHDVSKGVKVNDVYGYWTGKWRFLVQFKKRKSGSLDLPPRMIALGADKGRLYIPELPASASCWSCGKQGHQSKDCSVKRCTQCERSGHYASDCPEPKVCSLCSSGSHLFRSCPKRSGSYAGVVSQQGKAGGLSASASSASVLVSDESGKRKGEKMSHAAASFPPEATPHGEEKSGKRTKEASGDGAAGSHQEGMWDSSQEAEMVEASAVTAVGPVKRPLQDEEGDDHPGQRPRVESQVALSGQSSVLQEESDVEDDEAEEEDEESEGSVESAKEVELSPPGPLPGWDEKNLMKTTGMAPHSGGEPPP